MRSQHLQRLTRRSDRSHPHAQTYELWHARTKNLHGTYRSQEGALAGVWEALREQGEAYVRDLILAAEDAKGETRRVAAGDELLRMAEREAAGQAAVRTAEPELEAM